MASNIYRLTPKGPSRVKLGALNGQPAPVFVYINVELSTASAANAFADEIERLLRAEYGFDIPVNVKVGLPHGRAKWDKEGCRCDFCCNAASAYQREWLANR